MGGESIKKISKKKRHTQTHAIRIYFMNKITKLLIVGLGNPGKKYQKTRHNIGFLVVDKLAQRLTISMQMNNRVEAEIGNRTIDFHGYKKLEASILEREKHRIWNRLKYEKMQASGIEMKSDNNTEVIKAIEASLPKPENIIVDENVLKKQMEKFIFFPEVDVHLMKPQSFMNLSGQPVRHYMDVNNMKISAMNKLNRVLVIADDVHSTFGTMKLRYKGGDGGHNGLKNIERKLGTDKYHRLKMGIGPRENYIPNYQTFVLQDFAVDERKDLPQFVDMAVDLILQYIHQDPKLTIANASKDIDE